MNKIKLLDKNVNLNSGEKTVYFVDADQALFWYMEQKRKKYLVKTSRYESSKNEDNLQDRTKDLTVSELLRWGGVLQFPKTQEESAMVVASMDKIFAKLEKRTKVILMLHYLGDFATEELYKRAKDSQKILKERGYKVVMFYKYPKTKVAKMLNIDRKTVTRHVHKSYNIFYKELKKKGFIFDKDK